MGERNEQKEGGFVNAAGFVGSKRYMQQNFQDALAVCRHGLPHVRILIWLDVASKINLKSSVDKYVSAEIPDHLLDPVGYVAVKAFMIHGPCGVEFPNSPSAYHIFGFDIHHRSIVISRLSFHLPGQKNCTFRANESLEKVASRAQFKNSKLEDFFLLNWRNENAREFTYDEIPRHYVWNDAQMTWTVRKRGLVIGRLVYTLHSTGEIWISHLLLSKICDPTSFESLITVNGVLYPSFTDACKEHGFLDNDNEWHEVIAECSKYGFAPQIRELFVHIIVIAKRLKSGKPDLNLTEEHINLFALVEIDYLLKSVGKTLKNYPQIPQPPSMYIEQGRNRLIMEETGYDRTDMEAQYKDLYCKLNEEQMEVHNHVLDAVGKNEGGFSLFTTVVGAVKHIFGELLFVNLKLKEK
ncbi:uncharacterized protein LOC141718726 [Apium graveolens]|uniref:uncharacterized protein LOC141718726 n=1 Tax=Apium graveolens TaxID=4045 RepID=UPI003D7AC2ED